MASENPNPNAQALRRILVDLELGGRAAFEKDERRLVLQILLELVEKVAKLEDSAGEARSGVRDRTES